MDSHYPGRLVIGVLMASTAFGVARQAGAQLAWPDSGARVRVVAPRASVRSAVGTFVHGTSDSIRVRLPGSEGPHTFRTQDIQRLEVSMGHGRGANAKRGAAVGAGFGLAVGLVGMALLAGADVPEGSEGIALAGGVAAGGLLGLAIGATIPGERWRRIPHSTDAP